MSLPKRHHYLPQFYQRRWATSGEVIVYRRFPRGLSVLKRPPASVGFEVNLYTNPSDGDEARRQILETRVFQSIDNDAADALRYIEIEGKPPSDDRMRSGWARFLMSLMHRAPRRIESLRREVREKRLEIISELRDSLPKLAGLSDDEVFDIASADVTHIQLVRDLVNSDRVGPHLVQMKWAIVKFNDGHFPLLTSDRPLIRSNGMGHDRSFLVLAISPHTYFLATNNQAASDWFFNLGSRYGSSSINDMIVRQADEFVISINEGQTRFIDNRLLKGRIARDNLGEVTWNIP